MHVVKKKTLQDFWRTHAAAEIPLPAWLKDAERATWRTMHDIKDYARTADFVGDKRVVFNIGGNRFRLVVLCLLAKGRLYFARSIYMCMLCAAEAKVQPTSPRPGWANPA